MRLLFLAFTSISFLPFAAAQQIPHDAGDLFVETPELRAHFLREQKTEPPDRCRPVMQHISLIIRNEAAAQSSLSAEWLKPRIANDVYPAVKAKCPTATTIVAHVFFEDVFLGTAGQEISREDVAIGLSKEERFGAIIMNFEGPEPEVRRVLPFHRAPIGAGSEERATLDGLRGARDRGWKTEGLAATEADRAARQRAMFGAELPSDHVFAIFERGDDMSFVFDRSHRDGRWYADVTAQAYGLAAVEMCGDKVPGGVSERTIGYRSREGVTVTSETIRIPADLGARAYNYVPSVLRGGGTVYLYSPEAKEGPIRASVEAILLRSGCMSANHLQLHRNILAAVGIE